jgi:hypothetical protein
MTTDTLTEQRILTQIRQLSPDKIQKLEEFIDQLSQPLPHLNFQNPP